MKMERFNRLKVLINEYNQPVTLSPVIVPEDGLSFIHSLKANINLNRDLLGDTSYLQHILANDGQNLRKEWIDECKEILTRCNRSDELIEQWDQVWEEFKKIGFKSSDEINKLFLMFSAYKTRRHLVIIDDSSDNTSNSSDFIILVSGDIIYENNVANSSPILLCRVKSQDHRQHFQPLISTDSQFWRQFCEENIRYNKTGSNLIIIKKQNVDSRSHIQIKKEQLHDKPQELKSFQIKSQNMNSEETLNHHLVELNNGYNVKEQSIDLKKEFSDNYESHNLNEEDIKKESFEDPLQDFQSVQDVENTPKYNLEPFLGILVKEESSLEPSEVKTESLEYPQPYLLPNFDKITIKNEVKSELLDYNDEQDCGLYHIDNTCKDGKAKYWEREKFIAMEEDPEEEVNEKKRRAREKARLRQLAYRRKKMEEDPEGFKLRQLEYRKRKMEEDPDGVREKENERKRRQRMKKMQEDPEGFTEKENEIERRRREKNLSTAREKAKLRRLAYRRRKMEEDPKGFREKENESKRRQRMKQMQEDPEGVREKENEKVRRHREKNLSTAREKAKLRQLEYRRRKLEEDPEGFREKENERKRRHRMKRMQEDPEGFREKVNERKRRHRLKKMEQDPESKVRNEESKHKEVDYREGDFMGHQMESSHKGDEDNRSNEYIFEEKDDASIEEDNNISA